MIEAIVGPSSSLIEHSAERISLYERFHVNLIAVSRRGERLTERLRSLRFRAGDVVVLQGNLTRLPDTLRDLGCLPLASRDIRLGTSRRSLVPILVLAGAMALVAFDVLPVAVAFFAAAVVLILPRSLTLREAYAVIEWPILIMLGRSSRSARRCARREEPTLSRAGFRPPPPCCRPPARWC